MTRKENVTTSPTFQESIDHWARKNRQEDLQRAALLGVMSGIRSMSGPALLVNLRSKQTRIASRKAYERAVPWVTAMAVGETLADKTPWIPARIELLPLLGRVFLGGALGAATAQRGIRSRTEAAAVGAVSAAVATFAAYGIRQALVRKAKVPNVLAGALEDAALLGIAKKVAA